MAPYCFQGAGPFFPVSPASLSWNSGDTSTESMYSRYFFIDFSSQSSTARDFRRLSLARLRWERTVPGRWPRIRAISSVV